jgi:hypothetical protein
MKVKCIRLINPMTGEEKRRDSWLTVGKVYCVLSVTVTLKQGINFRIISDDEQTPILADSRQFKIISNDIPRGWIVNLPKDNFIELAPQKWTRLGFWEEFFNGEQEALNDFEEEKSKMMSEGR